MAQGAVPPCMQNASRIDVLFCRNPRGHARMRRVDSVTALVT
jgi:hypothetical protein